MNLHIIKRVRAKITLYINSIRIWFQSVYIFWNIGSMHFEICCSKGLITSDCVIFDNMKKFTFYPQIWIKKDVVKVEVFIMVVNVSSTTENACTSAHSDSNES